MGRRTTSNTLIGGALPIAMGGTGQINGHAIGYGPTPGIAAGAGAGTGPSVSVTGTDSAGEISVTTGTTPTAGATVFTVTFNKPFATTPYVVFSRSNANAALLNGTTMVFVTPSTTTFIFTAGSAALTASTQYKWSYHTVG
jgi:hypothetical protein